MCFGGDPVDKHGVPQAPLLLYLADQRPKHRKNYGRGGRYGTELRAAGGGWRGKDDPRYRPRDEPPPAEHRGGGGGGGGGFVYPPGPPPGGGGGGGRVRGDGGRIRVPPAVNAGRGNGGGRDVGGGPGPRRAASQANGGSQRADPPAPVVRDFGAAAADGAHDDEETEPQAPNLGFDVHTARSATVLSDSSSGEGNNAGAARPGAGAGGRGLDNVAGHIPPGRPLVSPPPSEAGTAHSRGTHRSGSRHGGRDAVSNRGDAAPILPAPSHSRAASVSSRGTHHSRGTQGGRGAVREPDQPPIPLPPPSIAASRHSRLAESMRGGAGLLPIPNIPQPPPSRHSLNPDAINPNPNPRPQSLARPPSESGTAPPPFRERAGASERALSATGTEGNRAARGARNARAAGERYERAPTYRTVDPARGVGRGGSGVGRGGSRSGRGGERLGSVQEARGERFWPPIRRDREGDDDGATLVD